MSISISISIVVNIASPTPRPGRSQTPLLRHAFRFPRELINFFNFKSRNGFVCQTDTFELGLWDDVVDVLEAIRCAFVGNLHDVIGAVAAVGHDDFGGGGETFVLVGL